MGFTANKKILVLGVANKKDLYLGTEGVENINNNACWATHVSDNFSHGLVHNFYEGVVVHIMEGLVVPDLNDTKCDLAHRNTTWNKRVAISKNNQQLKKGDLARSTQF